MARMLDDAARIPLTRDLFGTAQRLIVETPRCTVVAFAFSSGVEALRIRTPRVEATLLPFRGQQVWRYRVDGEELTMRTHFDEPARSTVFGETYGPFMLHCGLSGLGAPGVGDTHAHHGELPNATYEAPDLLFSSRNGVDTFALTGSARLRTSHVLAATFTPTLTLTSATTALRLDMSVTNDRTTPLQYSYLCHLNWAPVDGAELVQPVRPTLPEFIVDPHPGQSAETAAYTARITADPSLSNRIDLSQPLVPEYCAVLTPTPDADGWCEFLMKRPDGKAASVQYETAHLKRAIRWISNTGDEEAAGFCLPSTAHHHGRAAAEADGMLVALAPGQTHRMTVIADLLDVDAVPGAPV